jgi:hypothetical protein
MRGRPCTYFRARSSLPSSGRTFISNGRLTHTSPAGSGAVHRRVRRGDRPYCRGLCNCWRYLARRQNPGTYSPANAKPTPIGEDTVTTKQFVEARSLPAESHCIPQPLRATKLVSIRSIRKPAIASNTRRSTRRPVKKSRTKSSSRATRSILIAISKLPRTNLRALR